MLTFEGRLKAAGKVQEDGCQVRVRLEKIIPFNGWREIYAEKIKKISKKVLPERQTIATLRFEEGFYKMGNTLASSQPQDSYPCFVTEGVRKIPITVRKRIIIVPSITGRAI